MAVDYFGKNVVRYLDQTFHAVIIQAKLTNGATVFINFSFNMTSFITLQIKISMVFFVCAFALPKLKKNLSVLHVQFLYIFCNIYVSR